MSINILIKLVVFLPLLAALLVGMKIRSVSDRGAQFLTCGALFSSAVCAGLVFWEVAYGSGPQNIILLPWINSGDLAVNWSLKVDMLTAVMLIVVTWVSAVVHFYSVGYMSHDPHKPRFMAYLSLFTFFMLILVTADNFAQLFVGWEGVGLCSYLLIGFWFHKPEANAAAMKAFLVNRVGDIGLALGICLIFAVFGTIQYDAVFAQVASYKTAHFNLFGSVVPLLDLIGILLFIGCMGKSAQLLLHTWLPDAMEGPTPVSALIHAATMVTAGVFLMARCSPLFEYAPIALQVVTVTGAATAFFAATVGLVQNDIKRVIAYSTCSQLGYMFFACGVSAYSAGIFHLMTHAFFKALLFLGAGSVIHAMSDEQDMRNMGGVWKKIPYTYAYIWIGSLALAGIPFFAGYYSKDMILEVAYAAQGPAADFAFAMGIGAAFLTAFYSGRLIFMTFHGQPRASKKVMDHVHESPKIMMLPLLLLVGGALFAGAIGYYLLGMVDADGEFWKGAIVMRSVEHNILEAAHHVPAWVIALPLIMAVSGLLLSWLIYVRHPKFPQAVAERVGGLYRFLLNKWYFDELYDGLFVRPAKSVGTFLWHHGDEQTVDALGPDGMAEMAQRGGRITSQAQTGYLYHYVFLMVVGLLSLITWYVYSSIGG